MERGKALGSHRCQLAGKKLHMSPHSLLSPQEKWVPGGASLSGLLESHNGMNALPSALLGSLIKRGYLPRSQSRCRVRTCYQRRWSPSTSSPILKPGLGLQNLGLRHLLGPCRSHC